MVPGSTVAGVSARVFGVHKGGDNPTPLNQAETHDNLSPTGDQAYSAGETQEVQPEKSSRHLGACAGDTASKSRSQREAACANRRRRKGLTRQ